MPPLEAISSGCYTVTTDQGGNMDYCKDRVNCLIVDKSFDSFQSACEELFDNYDLQSTLFTGMQATSKQFSLEKTCSQFLAFIKSLYL